MTCLSELLIAATVFMFALGMMAISERGSDSDAYHANVTQALFFEGNLEELVDLQAPGQSLAMAMNNIRQVSDKGSDKRSFESLEAESSHWVILAAWQEYENGAAHPDTESSVTLLPVAAVEGYTMVAATYSFTHDSGYTVKPGEPVRVRF